MENGDISFHMWAGISPDLYRTYVFVCTSCVPNLCVSNFLVKKNGCRAQLDCLNNLLGTRSFMLMVGFGVSACECQYIIRATTLAKTKSITSKKIVSKIDPSFSL